MIYSENKLVQAEVVRLGESEEKQEVRNDNGERVGVSVNRGNVGRVVSCAATGGARGVETGVGRRWAFRQLEGILADTINGVDQVLIPMATDKCSSQISRIKHRTQLSYSITYPALS